MHSWHGPCLSTKTLNENAPGPEKVSNSHPFLLSEDNLQVLYSQGQVESVNLFVEDFQGQVRAHKVLKLKKLSLKLCFLFLQ